MWCLPQYCLVCSMPCRYDICSQCAEQLPWLDHKQCYDNTFAVFRYAPPIEEFLVALKFHYDLVYARVLGEYLADRLLRQWQGEWPEWIVPVPLHRRRLRERGFNQALEIAKTVSKRLQLPIAKRACQRVRHTQAQSSLPAKARGPNVKNCFTVSQHFSAQHVVILDDVLTTGNTVGELAKALHNQGVNRVDVWCVARA